MPLYATAQKHKSLNQPTYGHYTFPHEHKCGWMEFWKAMDGDLDKIIDFAKKAEIESPTEWFESLHWFLFDTFYGNPAILKKASASSFQTFLKQVAENHTKNPKPKHWYTAHQITIDKFVRAMEAASEIQDTPQAISFINARIMALGSHLYAEYLLSKTKHFSDLKSVASSKNKEAYEMEKQALGASPLATLKVGEAVTHALHPGQSFPVLQVFLDKDDVDSLVVESEGNVTAFEDVWNVARA